MLRLKKILIAQIACEEEELLFEKQDNADQSQEQERSLSSSLVKSVCICEVECSLSEFDDILPQGFLALLLRFALTIGYFDTFKEHLQLN